MIKVNFQLLPVVLLLTLIFLQYKLWFQSGSIVNVYHLKRDIARQEETNEALRARDLSLANQVHALQNSKQAIENHARHELGMVKKGETFYQVIDKGDQ